jgi:uncharacterized membrane protein
MTIEAAGFGAAALVIIMALVTLATRWGGVFVMGFVPISPAVERFINAMSGSVLVAILAPLAVEGDWGARLALASTAAIMLAFKKPLPAIVVGIVVAALWRQF